jgi:Ca-activated chloride channel family protein
MDMRAILWTCSAAVVVCGAGGSFNLAIANQSATVHDGVVSPTACAALGYRLPPRTEADYAGTVGGFGAPKLSIVPSPQLALPPPQRTSPSTVAPAYNGALASQAPTGRPFDQLADTEKYPHATLNPIKPVGEAPVSTFSTDVDTASYANVRRFLNEGRLPPRDAVRVEELLNYFDYGYAAPSSKSEPFRATIALTPSPWAPGKEIIHIGLKGFEVPAPDLPPLNLVFLVDTSGSMMSADRLPLAQKSLNVLIDQLRPQDRVSLVAYAGSAGAVLSPTAGTDKLKIRCAVDALVSGGSTAGGQGLALAYTLAERDLDKKAVNRVILMTDGDFNVGITDPNKLKDFIELKRKTGVYLSIYGYGRGNYNDALMQTLAQNGNGTAAYVDTLQEARKLFRDDFGGSLFPIADDVKIQVEFNPARVAEYRLIGYETRLLNREDFNNDQVDAGEVGAGVAVTALYEITPVGGPLSSDPLRYQKEPAPTATGTELAYFKVRYKLPGEQTSHLLQRPITDADRTSTESAPEATRWALAVAGYGQKLRGDTYVAADFGWDKVLNLAQGARGADPFGIRAEFVQLVRAVPAAKTVNE